MWAECCKRSKRRRSVMDQLYLVPFHAKKLGESIGSIAIVIGNQNSSAHDGARPFQTCQPATVRCRVFSEVAQRTHSRGQVQGYARELFPHAARPTLS